MEINVFGEMAVQILVTLWGRRPPRGWRFGTDRGFYDYLLLRDSGILRDSVVTCFEELSSQNTRDSQGFLKNTKDSQGFLSGILL